MILFVTRELTSVGVKAVRPTAGYYIFPDFEVIKENLKRRGIKTCEEMCQLMLDECGVAVSFILFGLYFVLETGYTDCIIGTFIPVPCNQKLSAHLA